MQSNKKSFILAAIIIGTLFLFIAGTTFENRVNRSSNTAEEIAPDNSPMVLVNAEQLYKDIGNDRQFNQLREDLSTYAQLAIPELRNTPTAELVFDVNLVKPKSETGSIEFEGSYLNAADNIAVNIQLLRNDLISSSVTNLRNDGNIDSRLPSNSKRNKFLATLPMETEDFRLEYNSSVDSFTITALSNKPNLRQQGIEHISRETGQPPSNMKVLYKPFIF